MVLNWQHASFSGRYCNEHSALMNISTEQNCQHEGCYTPHGLLQTQKSLITNQDDVM